MPIRPDELRLIKESLPLIRRHLEPASMRFYANLFAIAPEMRPLFRSDLGNQGMRFMSTLATIADLSDDPEALADELAELARAHARVGVRPEHFAPMGLALMVTLGETIGPAFTNEIQQAWRAAYDAIAEAMAERVIAP